jgi:hypothetical protein
MEKLEWSALEYEEKERSPDWFWALGVIVVTSSLAAIIYGNYFFALLIILSGLLLGFFAIKKPDTVFYELNERGLKIRTRLFPYENIESFWVEDRKPEDPLLYTKSTLFIKSQRLFMPIIAVPIDDALAPHIRSIFLSYDVPEEEMKEHPSEKIMESLGF